MNWIEKSVSRLHTPLCCCIRMYIYMYIHIWICIYWYDAIHRMHVVACVFRRMWRGITKHFRQSSARCCDDFTNTVVPLKCTHIVPHSLTHEHHCIKSCPNRKRTQMHVYYAHSTHTHTHRMTLCVARIHQPENCL